MMLNMLEKEDIVKGMSDDQLMKQAMYPDGELPQFLTVSEIQRRGKMRASYAERQPDSTVAEQIVEQSGILSNTQPNLLASSGYANPNMTQGYPQGMSQGMSQGGLQGNMAAPSGSLANINPMSGPTAMAASGGVVNLSNGGTGYIPYTQAGVFSQLDRARREEVNPRLEEMRKRYSHLPDSVLLKMIEEANMNQQVSAYDAATENLPPAFSKDYAPDRPISDYPLADMQRQGLPYIDEDVSISDPEEMRRNRLENAIAMQPDRPASKTISERIRSLSEIAQNPRMPFEQRQKANQTAQDLFGYGGIIEGDIIPAGIDAGGFKDYSASTEAEGLAALLDRGVLSEEDAYQQTRAAEQEEFNAMMGRLGGILTGDSPIYDEAGPMRNLVNLGKRLASKIPTAEETQGARDSIAEAVSGITPDFIKKLGSNDATVVDVNDATAVDADQAVDVDPAALMLERQNAIKGEGKYKGYSITGLDGGMTTPSGLAPQFNPFGSTASSELRALRGKSMPAPDFVNPALVAFGAGVADNNLAGGLRDASKILMQQKQYEAKAAQADLDRDVKILSEAGRIDAYIRTAEAQAQKLAAAGNVDASKLIFDILDYSETRPLNERAAYVYSSMATMLRQYPQLSSTIVPIMNSAKQDLQKQRAMEE